MASIRPDSFTAEEKVRKKREKEKGMEMNALATFHRLIRAVAAVVIVVADEALRDAALVVAAK